MRRFTIGEAKELAKHLGVDFDSAGFSVEEFLAGLHVELEHGLVDAETNVTGDDPVMTAKIVMAHLKENRLYYDKNVGVEAWEHALDEFKGDPRGKVIRFI